jgi:hypothetical protein
MCSPHANLSYPGFRILHQPPQYRTKTKMADTMVVGGIGLIHQFF